MHPYQFELDIVSVHYYRLQNWAYCAILLSTTFQLRNDKLGAKIDISIPLTAAHSTVRKCEDSNPCGDRGRRPEIHD